MADERATNGAASTTSPAISVAVPAGATTTAISYPTLAEAAATTGYAIAPVAANTLQLPGGAVNTRYRTESKCSVVSNRPIAYSWYAPTPDDRYFPSGFGLPESSSSQPLAGADGQDGGGDSQAASSFVAPTTVTRHRVGSGSGYGVYAPYTAPTVVSGAGTTATSGQHVQLAGDGQVRPQAQQIQLMSYIGGQQATAANQVGVGAGGYMMPGMQSQAYMPPMAYMSPYMGAPGVNAVPQQRTVTMMPPHNGGILRGPAVISNGLEGPKTTVVLQNLPDGYTRQMLLDLLDNAGFAGRYDFAYLPVAFDTMSGLNHAFVNMMDSAAAEEVKDKLTGFNEWPTESDKALSVAWNEKQQGLSALVERYRNSPVMHESVPDECKPVIIAMGRRAVFPKPTQKLKAPKILKKLGKAAE